MAPDNVSRDTDPERLVFSAVITPYRSLSPRGFALVIAAIGGTGFAAGLVFVALGAWPVFGFLGLDVALVYLAFRASYRSARARETILVTGRQVIVRRVSARGVRAEWTFNPYWTRLAVARDADGEVATVSLVSHGRRLGIAGWLSPGERADLAGALGAALAETQGGGAS